MKKILKHILVVLFLSYVTMFSQQQLFFDSLNEHETNIFPPTLLQSKVLPIDSITVVGSIYKTKYSYGYDANRNMSLYLYEKWNGEKRKIFSKYLLSYNIENQETLSVFQQWRENDSTWKNSLQVSKYYNSFGKKTTEILKHWSLSKGWRNYSKVTYSYDSLKGNLKYKQKEFWSLDSTWIFNRFSSKNIYTYDNNMIESLWEYWSEADSTFKPNFYSIYTYDDKLNSVLSKKNEGGAWVNNMQTTFTYNQKGDRIKEIKEFWKNDKWEFILETTFHPLYDLSGNIISDTVATWNGNYCINSNANFYIPNAVNYHVLLANDAPLILEQTNLFEGLRVSIYYDNTTDVSNKQTVVDKYSLLQNYPNPFNPTTTINYSLHEGGLVQLRVFDILGREVASLVNKEQMSGIYQVDFNASELSSGIYFYKINAGSFTETKKMILIK